MGMKKKKGTVELPAGGAGSKIDTKPPPKHVEIEGKSESTDDTNVGYRLTVKRNLGDYEMAEISVSLHVGCAQGDVDEAWDQIKHWVHEKVEEVHDDLGITEKD